MQLPGEDHLGCLQFWAIINNAVISIHVQISVGT